MQIKFLFSVVRNKECRRCESELPIASFYTHPRMMDGHLNICIVCTKKRVGTHRLRNIDRIRKYDVSRGDRQKAYKEKYPLVYRCHQLLKYSVQRGAIKKPDACSVCGSPDNIVGHHFNYMQPLFVMWLCKTCHCAWHTKNGRGKNHDAKDFPF